MAAEVKTPGEAELRAVLGSAFALWSEILRVVEGACGPIDQVWKPSKADFGRMCLVLHKKRTLLYLTPDKQKIWVAISLGERAFRLAMAGSLPEEIKTMFSEARPYAEGRGIRFSVSSSEDMPTIAALVEIKSGT